MSQDWIHLVRHGETTGQSSIRFFGKTDIPLADEGREQIRRLHPVIRERPLRAVYTSELSRARESARILLEGRELQPLIVPSFNEVNFGILEGKTEEEIERDLPDFWRIWRVERTASGYPEGDSHEGFESRVHQGAAELESRGSFQGEVLIVSHRGVIRHLLGYFLKLDHQQSREMAPELGEMISICRVNGSWRRE